MALHDLFTACGQMYTNKVISLLSKSIDPNGRNESGQSPLHIACMTGNVICV